MAVGKNKYMKLGIMSLEKREMIIGNVYSIFTMDQALF